MRASDDGRAVRRDASVPSRHRPGARAAHRRAADGPWTVGGFLIIAFQRPDVVLAGDLALRRAVRNVYDLDHMPGEHEVLELAEPWRPYRSLAVSYLFASEFAA
jgi:hypothetical protein